MDVMPLKPVEPIALPAGIGKIYRIIIIPVHRPVVFFTKRGNNFARTEVYYLLLNNNTIAATGCA
jgi:hypothetical protein